MVQGSIARGQIQETGRLHPYTCTSNSLLRHRTLRNDGDQRTYTDFDRANGGQSLWVTLGRFWQIGFG